VLARYVRFVCFAQAKKKEMMMTSRPKNQGAGLTEYVVTVALLAVGTLGVVMANSDNLRGLFSAADNAVAGMEEATTATRPVTTELHKNLSTFASNTPASFGPTASGTLRQAIDAAAQSRDKARPAREMNASAFNPWLEAANFSTVGYDQQDSQWEMKTAALSGNTDGDQSTGEASAESDLDWSDLKGEIKYLQPVFEALFSGELEWDQLWSKVKSGEVSMPIESVRHLSQAFYLYIWQHDDVATLEEQLKVIKHYPEETKQALMEKLIQEKGDPLTVALSEYPEEERDRVARENPDLVEQFMDRLYETAVSFTASKLDESRARLEQERAMLQEMQDYIEENTP
jgi:hypothetical protein